MEGNLMNALKDHVPETGPKCTEDVMETFPNIVLFVLVILSIFLIIKLVYMALRPIYQPTIVSPFLVGMILGNLRPVYDKLPQFTRDSLATLGSGPIFSFMFLTGLEMNPAWLSRPPRQESTVAILGSVTCTILAVFYSVMAHRLTGAGVPYFSYTFMLAVFFSDTSSPVLTRLTFELKISKSHTGKLAIAAGTLVDLYCIVGSSFLALLNINVMSNLTIVAYFTCLILIVWYAVPPICAWINDKNVEGKPMNGTHVLVVIAAIGGLCAVGWLLGCGYVMSGFFIGLFFPREGKLTRVLVHKMNFWAIKFVVPLYFCSLGLNSDLTVFNEASAWVLLGVSLLVGVAGKLIGTFVAGYLLGIPLLEGLVLGFLMNLKGHFHVIMLMFATQTYTIDGKIRVVLLVSVMITAVYVPIVVSIIVKLARRTAPQQNLALQWHPPHGDLRVIACMYDPRSVSTTTNILEALRAPSKSALLVYAMHLTELTESTAVSLNVGDEVVEDARQKIQAAYGVFGRAKGITIRHLPVMSPLSTMHEDVCNGAQDVRATLIIMPFHKILCDDDGIQQTVKSKFSLVNQKVLQHAPCSVGILVDRGFGGMAMLSVDNFTHHVAVVFIGGPDDREALAFGGQIVCHPKIGLTVVRFFQSSSSQQDDNIRFEREREQQQLDDDEFFNDFFRRHVATGDAGYMERSVADGFEMVAALRTLEGLYSLFIIGYDSGRNSTLTAGMSDWQDCLELGPIGDILAAPDFSTTASIIVIQQHFHRKETTEEEFILM